MKIDLAVLCGNLHTSLKLWNVHRGCVFVLFSGASPFLSLFIEGEALLNDGTAMVGFTVFYHVLIGQAELSGLLFHIGL